MSRIGRMPIQVPAGVEIQIGEGNVVTVKGPKGTLEKQFHPDMNIAVADNVLTATRPDDEKLHRSLHGLTRTLLHNMVVGVTEGYKKELEINGIGYRAQKTGTQVTMNLGFSHPVVVDEVEGITIAVPEPSKLFILGIDKQKVGQFAAEVRGKRPP